MSRVRPSSPAPVLFPPLFVPSRGSSPTDGLFPAGTLTYYRRARYPSGKGEVCKTFMRRFDSDPRLQIFQPHKRASRRVLEDHSAAWIRTTFTFPRSAVPRGAIDAPVRSQSHAAN